MYLIINSSLHSFKDPLYTEFGHNHVSHSRSHGHEASKLHFFASKYTVHLYSWIAPVDCYIQVGFC